MARSPGVSRWTLAGLVGLVATLTAPFALTGCSGSAASKIDYVVDGTLVSYNTNTVVGAASAGAQAFARTLTGFGYHGPDGQVVADRDFGTVSVVGGAPLVLDYQIADNAVYSDGKPVTCDDLVLTWAAQSGRFPGFQAATQAGYVDIANVECMPGQKKARVSFAPDRSVVDYTQLFAATSMMPSHVIADQLGVDVTAALLGNNAAVVDQIAKVWNTTWDLKPGLKPEEVLKRFPSSGPYKIQSVLDGGAVVLVANDRWWGPKAITKRITVLPQAADIQDRVNNRSVDVVDVAVGSSGALATPDNYQRSDSPSAGIEQLIFALQGSLALARERRAVALCTPRDAIARDAGVAIANSRLNPATEDAVTQADGATEAGRFGKADPGAARDALAGAPLTVADRLPGAQRAAGGDDRDHRQVLRAGRHHRDRRDPGSRERLLGPAGAAGRQDRRAVGQHGRSHRQRIKRIVGDGRLRPAQRQWQQPVRVLEPPGRRHHRRAGGVRRSSRAGPAAGRGRAGALGGHADAAPVPPAAHAADVEENVCGNQESNPLGRGLEHGPMGSGSMTKVQ